MITWKAENRNCVTIPESTQTKHGYKTKTEELDTNLTDNRKESLSESKLTEIANIFKRLETDINNLPDYQNKKQARAYLNNLDMGTKGKPEKYPTGKTIVDRLMIQYREEAEKILGG